MRHLERIGWTSGIDLVIRVTIPEARTVEEATAAILNGDDKIVVEKDEARISGTAWSYGHGTIK
jgi:hypothetical protein